MSQNNAVAPVNEVACLTTGETSASTLPHECHSAPEGTTTPEALKDEGHIASTAEDPSIMDQLEFLKAKILELEQAARPITSTDNGFLQPIPELPLNPNLEALHPTEMRKSEEIQRMNDYMYRSRRAWEAARETTPWLTWLPRMPRRHQYGTALLHRDPDLVNLDDPTRHAFQRDPIMYGPDVTLYKCPNPFDRNYDLRSSDEGEATLAKEGFDRVIDYGSRRERLRQNFEWELDRLFLEEEIQIRRRKDQEGEKEQPNPVTQPGPVTQPEVEKQGAEAVSVEAVNVEAVENESSLPEPKHRHVDWFSFIESHLPKHKDTRHHGIVDVLLGEPVVSESQPSRGWYGSSSRKLKAQRKPVGYRAPAKPTPDKGPLPERLRITSTPLFNILSKILEEDQLGFGYTPRSFVFVRPFKGLLYSQKALQNWCEALEKRFSPTTTWKTETPIDAEVCSTSQSGMPGSAQTDARSPSRDESLVQQAAQDKPSGDKEKREGDSARIVQEDNDDKDEEDDDPDDVTKSLLALKHLRCLLEVIDMDIASRQVLLSEGKCRKVWYSDLWLLFRQGVEVIAKDGKQAYQVIETASAKHSRTYSGPGTWKKDPPFRVICVHIDFDGKFLGPVCKTFEIPKFDGERDITSLAVYPLTCHSSKRADFSDSEWERIQNLAENDRFRQKLIMRGRKFLEVAAVKQMYYTGPTLDALEEVESQVVVDFETAFSMNESVEKNENWQPELEELIGKESYASEELDGIDCFADCCAGQDVVDEFYVDGMQKDAYLDDLLLKSQSLSRQPPIIIIPRTLEDLQNDRFAFSDDELVIMSHRVFGFILRNRKWAKMDLDHLAELYESPDTHENLEKNTRRGTSKDTNSQLPTFDRLVLQSGHKEMIISLITQHFRNKEASTGHKEQFDIVKGKGKGLIVLLHGAPGVGKTSTAEAVAEQFHKTLFQITCGDLGTTASEVEKSLETNFALANRWDCILLLDEADVFLAQRNKEDFIRNGLVAVFLRVMEYYSGVLFLTTNRVGDFDEAFTSRIHVSLYYPELDIAKTAEVFKINLNMIEDRFKIKGSKIDIDKDGILKFASQYYTENPQARLNGRQIRNACQTALALAEYETLESNHDSVHLPGQTVNLWMKHFEKVRDAYLEFAKYVSDIFGGVDARRRAKEANLRAIWDAEYDGSPMADRRSAFQQASRSQSQLGQQHIPQTYLQPNMSGMYQAQPMQSQYYQFPPAAPVVQGPNNPFQSPTQSYQQFPNAAQYGNSGAPQAEGASFQGQTAGQNQFAQQGVPGAVPHSFTQHMPATPMTPTRPGNMGQQGPSA